MLELGGKSANLVLEDADLEAAARQAAQGIVTLTGQACVAPTRLLVHETVYDDMVDAVLDNLGSVQVGDPFDADTTMGPVVSQSACRRILSMVERASAESPGKLLLGGHRLEGDLSDGFFIPPTVFTEVSNPGYLAQHEVFGPVLSVLRFANDDEAIAMANDSDFGLAAYVHTRDLDSSAPVRRPAGRRQRRGQRRRSRRRPLRPLRRLQGQRLRQRGRSPGSPGVRPHQERQHQAGLSRTVHVRERSRA